MVIKNLTPRMQELKIVEFATGRSYTVYLEGYGCTDIEGCYIHPESQTSGLFEFDDAIVCDADDMIIEEEELGDINISEEEIPEDFDNVLEEEIPEEIESDDVHDEIVCDICGAEFGSERGLNLHKKKVHSTK